MSNKTLHLTPALYQYFQNITLKETPVLAHLRRETKRYPHPDMQIAPEQGQFMGFLLQVMGARKVLEIGTYTGYSALVMAQALPTNGIVVTCDIDDKNTELAKAFWSQAGVSHKIEFKLGPALNTLDALIKSGEAGTFDFVFIDADKPNNQNYFEKSLTLLRPGGVIAVDNIFLDGKVSDSQCHSDSVMAVRAFNEALRHDNRVSMCNLPIADGLALARKL